MLHFALIKKITIVWQTFHSVFLFLSPNHEWIAVGKWLIIRFAIWYFLLLLTKNLTKMKRNMYGFRSATFNAILLNGIVKRSYRPKSHISPLIMRSILAHCTLILLMTCQTKRVSKESDAHSMIVKIIRFIIFTIDSIVFIFSGPVNQHIF